MKYGFGESVSNNMSVPFEDDSSWGIVERSIFLQIGGFDGAGKEKRRREQRIAEARAKKEALKPDSITCNNCKAEITDITVLDTRNMDGVESAFAGICPECKETTWAIGGDPEAVADVMVALEAHSGGEEKLSHQVK
ncbi:hypothetical protein [Sedimenticola sp.]|uniref:hypothetical protein n=1 Tax=Sedimenticola sp. TaxID=1940285 RepID=UPI003D0DFC4A